MQGPPGTGKSQTITNIIAQALADGKKILFVSEKMAALDVVYRRLSDVHLSDFCLSLHSHKANKKEILDQLSANLSLQRIKVKDEEIAKLTRLDMLREQLKAYVNDIHQVVMPLEMSLYEVYGAILDLGSLPDIDINLANVDKMAKDDVNRLALLVMNFDKAKDVLGLKWYKNPWQGITTSYLEVGQKRELQSKLKDAIRVLSALEECKLVEKTLAEILSVDTLDDFKMLYEHARHCIMIPNSWFYRTVEQEERTIRVLRERKKEIDYLTQKIEDRYDKSFLVLSGQEVLEQFITLTSSYCDMLRKADTVDTAFGMMEYDLHQVQLLKENYQLMIDTLNVFSDEYGLQLPLNYESIEIALSIGDMLLEKRKLTDWYFIEESVETKNQYVKEIFDKLSLFVAKSQYLCNKYSDDIFDCTTEELLSKVVDAQRELSDLITAEGFKYYGLCRISDFDLTELEYIEGLLQQDTFEVLSSTCGLQRPVTLNDIYSQISVLEKAKHNKILDSWQTSDKRNVARQLLKELYSKTTKLAEDKEKVKSFLTASGFSIDIDGISENVILNLQNVCLEIPEPATIIANCNNNEAYSMLNEIKQKLKKYAVLLKNISTLQNEYRIKADIGYLELLSELEAIHEIAILCTPCNAWTTSKSEAILLQRKMTTMANTLKEQQAKLLENCDESVLSFDFEDVLNRFLNEYIVDKKELLEFFKRFAIVLEIDEIAEADIKKLQQASKMIIEATTIVGCCNNQEAYTMLDMIDEKVALYTKLDKEIAKLRSDYKIKDEIKISDLLIALKERRDLIIGSKPCLVWSTAKKAAISLVEQVILISDSLKKQYEQLMQKCEESVFGLDYIGMLNRFKAEYTSFFKVFKSTYKSDVKQIRLVLKEVRKKISDDEIVTLLQALKQYNEDLESYAKLSYSIAELLDIKEYDIWFDWKSVKNQLNSFDIISQIFTSDEATYCFIAEKYLDKIYDILVDYEELSNWFKENKNVQKFYGKLYAAHKTDTKYIREALNHVRTIHTLFESPEYYIKYMGACSDSADSNVAIETQSFFRFFSSQYKDDVKKISSIFKDTLRKIDDNEIIAVLQALQQYHIDLENYKSEASQVSELFNINSYNICFDWEAVQKQLDAFVAIGKIFQDDTATYRFIVDNDWNVLHSTFKEYAELKEWFDNNESAQKMYGKLYTGVDTNVSIIQNALNHANTMCSLFVSPNQYLEFLYAKLEVECVKEVVQSALDIVEARAWFEMQSKDIEVYTGVSYEEGYNCWADIESQLDTFESIAEAVGDAIGYALIEKYRTDNTAINKHINALLNITKLTEYAESVYYVISGDLINSINLINLVADIRKIVFNAESLQSVYKAISKWYPDSYQNLTIDEISEDLYILKQYHRICDELPMLEEEAKVKLVRNMQEFPLTGNLYILTLNFVIMLEVCCLQM